MELKDVFKKVGSDPCVVLDFDSTAKLENMTDMYINSLIFESTDTDECNKFIAEFTNMFVELSKTKTITTRLIVKNNTTLIPVLNDFVLTNSAWSCVVDPGSENIFSAGYIYFAGDLKPYYVNLITTIDGVEISAYFNLT